MIIVLAGRRIDAMDASISRFPLQNADDIYQRIRTVFVEQQACTLVCSGACGADLLALEVAGELGIQRHMVLPFEQNRFREISVTDRPGAWGSLFDRISKEIEATGHLKILPGEKEDNAAFIATNAMIFNEAFALAQQVDYDQNTPGATREHVQTLVLAVIVWDGISRGQADVTASFVCEAHAYKLPIIEIGTA